MNRYLLRERGSGFFGVIIIVAVLGVVGFVGFRFLMLRIHYSSVKEVVKNRATYAISYSDDSIRRDIIQTAFESGINIPNDSIYVFRERGHRITIQVPFSDTVDLIVKKYPYHFLVTETAPLPG